MSLKKFLYGDLNNFTRNDFLSEKDMLQDPFDIASNLISETFLREPDRVGPFRGQVLRVIKEEIPLWQRVGAFFSNALEPQWACRVRIPERDCHLAYPDNTCDTFEIETDANNALTQSSFDQFLDFQKIEMHGLFHPAVTGMPIPTAGDIVWVEYKNGRGFIVDMDRDATTAATNPTATPTAPVSPGTRPVTPAIAPRIPATHPPAANAQVRPVTAQNVSQTEARRFLKRVNDYHRTTLFDLDKWADFIHYDIKTDTVNGKEITLLASEIPVYKAFIQDYEAQYAAITGQSIKVIHSEGESFRLVGNRSATQSGGKFLNGSTPSPGDGAQHVKGTAIDVPQGVFRRGTAGTDKSRANISFFFQIAIKHGYMGFGVGSNIVHIDRRSNPAFWSYSSIANAHGTVIVDAGDTEKIVRKAYQLGDSSPMPIPDEWYKITEDKRATAAEAQAAISARTFQASDLI